MHFDCCRVCAHPNGTKHSVYPSFPIFIWPVPLGDDNEFTDIGVYTCDSCGHPQLHSMTDDFVTHLYSKGSFVLEDRGVNDRRQALFATGLGADFFDGKRVIDIGGGHNPIAESLGAAETWVIDLAPVEGISSSTVKVVAGRIEEVDLPHSAFDIGVSLLSMEHFNNPRVVVARMAQVIKPGGVMLVEVPNLAGLVDETPHYTVFHQHVSIFTPQSLDSLFQLEGFRRIALLQEDGSILAAYENAQLPSSLAKRGNPEADLDRLCQRLEQAERDLRAIELPADPAKVALYPAGGSTSLLIAHHPWLKERIGVAFDRDEGKQGRLLPGTTIPILPPEQINSSDVEVMLVQTGELYHLLSPHVAPRCVNLDHVTGKRQ